MRTANGELDAFSFAIAYHIPVRDWMGRNYWSDQTESGSVKAGSSTCVHSSGATGGFAWAQWS